MKDKGVGNTSLTSVAPVTRQIPLGESRKARAVPGRRFLSVCAWLLALALLLAVPGTVNSEERNIERYAVRRVDPVYPPLAQKQRIEGVVVIQLAVANNGKVTNAEFIRGNNIFRAVSLEAARKWEFKVPNGETLDGTIRFIFKLES